MSHYIVELIIWTLVAYLIGCIVGWLLRSLFGSSDMPAPVPAPAPVYKEPFKPEAAPAPAAAVKAEEPAPPVPPAPRMERPKGIDAPRGGKPDDLQEISGIGPKNEKILHTLGFFHFDQIAAWGAGEVAWVDDHLKFNGRIGREEWVNQAKLLAAGARDEFTRLYGPGGERNKRS